MKKNLLLLFLIFFFGREISFGQNLVPNPNFSDSTCSTICPPPSQFCLANWYSPTNGTPDYFSLCSESVIKNWCGFDSTSFINIPVAGIIVYNKFSTYREYISVKLNEPMEEAKKYNIEFYTKICKFSIHAVDKIGLYIGDSLFQNNTLELPYIPQINSTNNDFLRDSTKWYLISGEFVALGGEQFITIGNFSNNALTNTDSIDTGIDYNSYYLIDNVSITKIEDTVITEFSFFPNPNNGNITLNYNLGNFTSGDFIIYNSLGQIVYSEILNQNNGVLNRQLNLASGFYNWQVYSKDNFIKGDKFIIVKE